VPIDLRKAIKSTHRHPTNRILHCIGAPIYVAGITLILNNLLFGIKYPAFGYAITLFCTAIGLFLLGHKTEGNLKAMTLILLFKYLVKSRKSMVSADGAR
jgi:uncharacterized membrane protein YGL010W